MLSKHPFGFRLGTSCIDQLLVITYDILLSFDFSLSFETGGVFLDISKAFARVWFESLLFKLKQNRVIWNMLQLIKRFIGNKAQRVTLNGQTSYWE